MRNSPSWRSQATFGFARYNLILQTIADLLWYVIVSCDVLGAFTK